MERTSKVRRLFQALSLLSALACVLLILLWVRSYSWRDFLHWHALSTEGNLSSAEGRLDLKLFSSTFRKSSPPPPSGVTITPIERWREISVSHSSLGRQLDQTTSFGFAFSRFLQGVYITVPVWAPVLITATLAAAPWINNPRPQFSLRTLLISTTLVAVVLGVAVALWR